MNFYWPVLFLVLSYELFKPSLKKQFLYILPRQLGWLVHRFLPQTLLEMIFKHLNRRDKLACTLVCPEWRNGMDYSALWKTMVISIDEDFIDNSTMLLCRYYYKHLKSLEIGWANPIINQSKWSMLKYKDLTKRVGRYLILLYENYVQLDHVKIFEWYDIFQLRKLSYLLLRFIKHQYNLKSICLVNANLHEMDFSNILVACVKSKRSVISMELRYTWYFARKHFDASIFTSCMSQFVNLKYLVIDFWIWKALLLEIQDEMPNLINVIVILDQNEKNITPWTSDNKNIWWKIKSHLPNIMVHLKIYQILNRQQLQLLLDEEIPLKSLFWRPFTLEEDAENNYKSSLCWITSRFKLTLESIHLEGFGVEIDDFQQEIKNLKRKCPQLKTVQINRNGVVIQR